MANITNLSQFLSDIADAIRIKKETTEQIPAENFDQEILSIETGTEINNQDKEITENGTYIADEGYTGLGTVTVNVPQEGGSGEVKLFETEKEMNDDTTAKEGDLAIIYKNEVQNATVDSQFQTAIFPETVVLDTAITDSIEVRYRAVDSSVMFDCWGNLDMNMFSMNCYSENGEVRIEYESSDGITYTRTRLEGEGVSGDTVDFGTEIYYEYAEMWDNVIGKFIQCGGYLFNGLYKFNINVLNKNLLRIPYISDFNPNFENSTFSYVESSQEDSLYIDIAKLEKIIKKNFSELAFNIYGDGTNWYILPGSTQSSQLLYNDVWYLGNEADKPSACYKIDFDNETVTNLNVTFTEATKTYSSSKCYYTDIQIITIGKYFSYSQNQDSLYFNSYTNIRVGRLKDLTTINKSMDSSVDNIYYSNNKYLPAPTQLNTTQEYVYEKAFYGKNGVETGTLQNVTNLSLDEIKQKSLIFDILSNMTTAETDFTSAFSNYTGKTIPMIDTSNVTDMSYMFSVCNNLITIPQLNTSNVTNMEVMFSNCPNLETIPELDTGNVTRMNSMFMNCTNLTSIPQLNTVNVTSMNNMFYKCTNLSTIPQLDTSNVTNIGCMFQLCTNLETIPELDTNKVTYMAYMFDGCTNLVTIPQLNTSSVKDIQYMFRNCTSLSEESLNNILAMCINATAYTSTKTLKTLSISKEQAAKCKTLSNYSAFTSAGWTTGY